MYGCIEMFFEVDVVFFGVYCLDEESLVICCCYVRGELYGVWFIVVGIE